MYPSARFGLGSIEAIHESDGALGGILSWFSIIHYSPSDIGTPLAEFHRTLRRGGTLMLGYFDSSRGVEPFDHAVVRAYRWPLEEMLRALENAGFVAIDIARRAEVGERPVGAVWCEAR